MAPVVPYVMAQLTPYLFFDGGCREALDYYAKIFGGEVNTMSFDGAPMEISDEQKNHVMHGSLTGGIVDLMASDGMQPGERLKESNTVALSVAPASIDEGKRLFDALADDGQVMMTYEKQFWGDVFGHVIDKYGIHWMINAS